MIRPIYAGALATAVLLGCGKSHDEGAKTGSADLSAASAPSAAPAVGAPAGSSPVKAASRAPVATVNGATISASKVESVYRMNRTMLAQRGQTLSPADDQELRAQSLDSLIGDELLSQASLQSGVTIPPADIETAVKQIRARAGSDAAYGQVLAAAGLTESGVGKEVERNLRIEAFRKTLVAGRGVTESQAKKYYDANLSKGVFNVPERVHVQYILVKSSEQDPESVRAEAKKRAEDVARRAAAGEDFSALAKQYSQDGSAPRGGDVGYIPRGVMFPAFEEMAFSSKPGAVSKVFETPKGFNVLKVLDKKPAATRGYDEVKDDLLAEMGRLMEQDIVNAKVRELASTAKIDILDPSFKRLAPPAPETAKR